MTDRAAIEAEYAAANAAFDATSAAKHEAAKAYRAGGSQEAFLAAVEAHKASEARFDAAFAAMQDLPEVEAVEEADASQPDLFAA